MERNVHLANLEYGLCNVYSYKTHSFRSEQNGRIFTIFHRVNRKCNFVIYLLEYKSHIQYVGTAETDFNLRLNDHHKNVYKANVIPASRHFAMKNHISKNETSFIRIKQIRKKHFK